MENYAIRLCILYNFLIREKPIPFLFFSQGEKQILVTAEEDRTDIAMVMMTTRKMVSSDIKLRHATAIIMLGVIGAEFQKEIDPINRDSKYSSKTFEMEIS